VVQFGYNRYNSDDYLGNDGVSICLCQGRGREGSLNNTDQNSDSSRQGPILVAVDFSADSRAALTWACEVADWMQTSVLVFHVVHDSSVAPDYYKIDDKDWLAPLEEAAASRMQKFVAEMQKAGSGFKSMESLKSRLAVGRPVPNILEVADEIDARLIVMGSQGLTGLAHLLIGSKAEQVVRLAKIPVTIVKGPRK